MKYLLPLITFPTLLACVSFVAGFSALENVTSLNIVTPTVLAGTPTETTSTHTVNAGTQEVGASTQAVAAQSEGYMAKNDSLINGTNSSVPYNMAFRPDASLYAATVPIVFEMFSMFCLYMVKDWKLFLELKWYFMSNLLVVVSLLNAFLDFYFKLKYQEQEKWISQCTYIYFTLLVEFQWTSLFSANFYFNHMQSDRIIKISNAGILVRKIMPLAVEVCGSQACLALFLLCVNSFGEGNFFDKATVLGDPTLPIDYFTLSFMCIGIMCVASFIYTNINGMDDLQKSVFYAFRQALLYNLLMSIVWILWMLAVQFQIVRISMVRVIGTIVGAIISVSIATNHHRISRQLRRNIP